MSRPNKTAVLPTLRSAGLAGLLALTLFLPVPSGRAQPLRVTTWNLQPPANTNAIRIPAAAATLRRLDPDVILLQQVTDWAMCEALAQALKPAQYKVVICSAFRDAPAETLPTQQVGILAKANAKAYFSWSERWASRGLPAVPGGLAFAALEIGKQRVGLFSVQAAAAPAEAAGDQPSAASPQERLTATVEQLLEHVGSVSNWVANRVQVFVVGGSFGLAAGQKTALPDTSLELLHEAGFGDAFQDRPAAERATMWARPGQTGPTADYLFTQPASPATAPEVSHVAVARHYPATCEVDLGLSTPVAAQAKRVAAAPAPASPPLQPGPPAAVASAQPSTLNPQVLWPTVAAVAAVALVALGWMLAGQRRATPPLTRALLTTGGDAPSGYTVVLTTQSATESVSSSQRLVPAARPLIQIEASGATETPEVLRQRALAAEQRAERATAVIRAGLLPQLSFWLKQTLVRKLLTDRESLLQTQQAAALKAIAVEQRLNWIEQQIQQQNHTYEQRIQELTQLLAVAKEQNRELIRARIVQVKAEMAAARARLVAQSEPDDAA